MNNSTSPSTFQKWNLHLGKLFTWAILGFLAFVLFALFLHPSHPSRERVNKVKCASNLRQIGQAIETYFAAHHQYPDALSRLVELESTCLFCPSDSAAPTSIPTTLPQEIQLSYVYRAPTTDTPQPQRVLAHDKPGNHVAESKGMNLLYATGQVDWVDETEMNRILSELNAGFNPPRPRDVDVHVDDKPPAR